MKILIDTKENQVKIGSAQIKYTYSNNHLFLHTRDIYCISNDEYELSNTKSDSCLYQLIKDVKIEEIPNNLSISFLNIKNNKTEQPMERVMMPFQVVEFMKHNDNFYVIFSRFLDDYEWESNWTINYYFERLEEVTKDNSEIWVKGEHPTSTYTEEEKWLFMRIDNSILDIKSSLDVALAKLDNIEKKLEESFYGLSDYTKLITKWEKCIDEKSESFWQKLFEEYCWILAQCFSDPNIILQPQAYVGGICIDGKKGNYVDFTYKNAITNSINLIEIKSPITKLVGRKYRNTYMLSSELSGAVNQLIYYKDELQKSYYQNIDESDNKKRYMSNNPKCILIIGNLSKLNVDEKKCFELFRNELRNIIIITFDELLLKVKEMMRLFVKDKRDITLYR
ncbi:DUF4263 domain-containing protein [Clostridium sp. PL3]|uniref:DUF4263 domain-containing protein n=1 Tax=Clostridium thailandense TaxID=2794346 RepID=A0A949WTH1_9CLOT|nr:Shedu immune nuclease family protein [Clostridium thailandense]MBV7271477.1 DUF4263 domain-containing protein [Clostridium thailandense]